MSHGDHVTRLPDGFHTTATTGEVVTAIENPERGIYCVQFHPEVSHTPLGKEILRNFLFNICGCKGDWTPAQFIKEEIEKIRNTVGPDDNVVCGLSGGVDSTVAAVLVHEAIGDRQTCIFVNNGLLRYREFEDTLERLQDNLHLNVAASMRPAIFTRCSQASPIPSKNARRSAANSSTFSTPRRKRSATSSGSSRARFTRT